MKKYKNPHKRIEALLLAIVVAVCTIGGVLYFNPFHADAIYATDKAITFGEFNSRTPVADKYFFVGTYLFSLDVISDEIYEKALSSQSEMNQFNEYYKSELAGGIWYDISDATDLTNITVNGTKVDENELNKLYVTVYIDENGKSYDAKTMASATIFDSPNPYDLKEIPELNTLYSQYKAMFSENSKGINLYYYETLKSFFDTDLRLLDGSLMAETNRLDRILQNLQVAYETLIGEGKTEEAEEVQKIMRRVDNSRRALIYKKLAIGSEGSDTYELNKLVQLLSNMAEGGVYDMENYDEIEQSTMPYDVWTNSKKQYTYNQLYDFIKKHDGLVSISDDEDDEDAPKVVPDFGKYFQDTPFDGATADKETFKQNDAIISTLNDADSDCKKAYDQYTSDSVLEPDSHIGKAVYKCEEALFAEAESGYSEAMSSLLEELVVLNNIGANVVVDKEKELAKIKTTLLPECESGFKSLANGGVGMEYSAASAQGANDDGLTSALESQAAQINQEMTELEFMITAYRMRVTPKECFQATLGWIDQTDALLSGVVEDEFASKAKVAINSHKAWLTDLLEQLVKEDESLQSELDKLKAQKDALNEEKRQALDNNDLNGAKKVDEKIKEIDRRIDEETAKNANTAGDSSASAGEQAAAAVALAGTTEGAAQAIKQDALKKIQNGEDASDEVAALEELGADDALKEVKEAEDKSDNKDDQDGSDGKDGKDGKNGSGDGAKNIATLSEQELKNLIASVLGAPFEELDPSGKVVAAVALEWAGDAGNVKAKALAKNFIEICANEKNPYVYDTYIGGASTFARLSTIGAVTKYRYLYNNSGKEGTLAKGSSAYTFRKDSKEMKIDSSDSTAKMDFAAVLKYGSLYISEKTAKEYFDLSAEPIKAAKYSAVLNSKMESQAKELLEVFKNGGTN